MDWLIQQKAIRSKSSFVREVVAAAAEEEVRKLWRIQEALKQMEAKKK